jgi:sodium-dependent dicarboxylate transporter 2/3/5
MGAWMIAWWIFAIAPLGATALIPLVFLPTFQIMPLNEITPFYSNSIIFLFLGGFILARGLEKTELSERFALNVLRLTGRSGAGIVIGFVISTALLSMWISNTATAIMMIPIAQSVLKFLEKNTENTPKEIHNITTVIYLSIAYAANIGGTMTPIGSPPNVVLVGFLESLYQIKIDFWKWMLIMVPVSMLLLGLQFLVLNRLFKYKIEITENFRVFIRKTIKELSPFNNAQKLALSLFCLSCGLWIFKDLINYLTGTKLLDDTTIALLGGTLFFFFPYNFKGFKRILDETDIPTLPWNIILLFGGGMTLAGVMEKFGIIQSLLTFFEQVPASSPYLLVLLLSLLTLILTEVMSNVALCMIALPLLMSLGVAKGIDPILMGLPAAICSSYAFSLPIATPPNAIVFGTNKIAMKDMLRAGILMNILGLTAVMTLGWFLMKNLL